MVCHFCLCCPAGGLSLKIHDFVENQRLVVFVCVALRAAFFENTRLVVFVCVALRAASILKNRVFWYLINVLEVTKHFYLADLSIGSALERLVLKNDADCTSQRLKWTSGARFMIIFRRFTYKRLFSL